MPRQGFSPACSTAADVTASRRRKLRRAAATAADERPAAALAARSGVDAGVLAGCDDDRHPLGAGDADKADDGDAGMVPHGDGEVAQFPRLEPVPPSDDPPASPAVAAHGPAASSSASWRSCSERKARSCSSRLRWLARRRSTAEGRSEG